MFPTLRTVRRRPIGGAHAKRICEKWIGKVVRDLEKCVEVPICNKVIAQRIPGTDADWEAIDCI